MSALTHYNTLKSTLGGLGYKELPGLMDIEEVKESHSNLGYVLQPIGTRETVGNDCLMSEYNWRLEIVYKSKNAENRVDNFVLFQTIKEVITELANFNSFISNPTFRRLGTFTHISVGTLEFIYGIETS